MAIELGLLTSPVIGVFVVLVLAEYTGIRKVAEKGFNWIAAGAVLILLAVFSELSFNANTLGALGLGAVAPVGTLLAGLFSVLGGIAVLVGALLAVITLLQEQ